MRLASPHRNDQRDIDARYDTPFGRDVMAGLSATPKSLPSKHLYDARGSELFEAICTLPEYYPTRTESLLLQSVAGDIARIIPPGSVLVEFGSGASDKTRILLDAATHLHAYVPIDISKSALDAAAAAIQRDYPNLRVVPAVADFTAIMNLPSVARERPRVGFFPDSTIGNFTRNQAVDFLAGARTLLGAGALFVLGADIVKDADVLVPAYDDAQGVTAAFNLNVLARINRELDGDIDLSGFTHRAIWNENQSRIEMHLVSRTNQNVHAAGHLFRFAAGETIHTENSHKFTQARLDDIANAAGWRTLHYWESEAPAFAIAVFRAD